MDGMKFIIYYQNGMLFKDKGILRVQLPLISHFLGKETMKIII